MESTVPGIKPSGHNAFYPPPAPPPPQILLEGEGDIVGIPFKGQLTCLSCVTGERRPKSFVQTSARSSNPCLSSQKQTCPASCVRFGEVRFEATFQWPCVAASASEVSGPQTFQAALPRS